MNWFLAAGLVAVFVGVVLLLSIVIWSIRRHRDPKLHIECSSPIDELMPSLAGLTLSTAVAGNSVEVLENGAFFGLLLQRIRSAPRGETKGDANLFLGVRQGLTRPHRIDYLPPRVARIRHKYLDEKYAEKEQVDAATVYQTKISQ